MEKVNRNNYSVTVIREFVNNIESSIHINSRPLRYCTASVFDVYEGEAVRYTVLRSYSTIVAYYDHDSKVFCDILRAVYGYTATSAQHIAKFKNDLRYHIARDIRYM